MEAKSLNKLAASATLHCLAGCAIGEVIGSVIGVGLGWSNMATEFLTVPLAFFTGYSLTVRTLLNHNTGVKKAVTVALSADTLSIVTMEISDTLVILLIPGALAAGPSKWLFWLSLALALGTAYVVTVPVNRWLLGRGRGHAIVHESHQP